MELLTPAAILLLAAAMPVFSREANLLAVREKKVYYNVYRRGKEYGALFVDKEVAFNLMRLHQYGNEVCEVAFSAGRRVEKDGHQAVEEIEFRIKGIYVEYPLGTKLKRISGDLESDHYKFKLEEKRWTRHRLKDKRFKIKCKVWGVLLKNGKQIYPATVKPNKRLKKGSDNSPKPDVMNDKDIFIDKESTLLCYALYTG